MLVFQKSLSMLAQRGRGRVAKDIIWGSQKSIIMSRSNNIPLIEATRKDDKVRSNLGPDGGLAVTSFVNRPCYELFTT